MRGSPDTIRPGAVYLLEDFTYVQVVDVTPARVRFRRRNASALVRLWPSVKRSALEAFRRRVRAEVDPAYFPDLAEVSAVFSGPDAAETARLEGALRAVAMRRPFGAVPPDQP